MAPVRGRALAGPPKEQPTGLPRVVQNPKRPGVLQRGPPHIAVAVAEPVRRKMAKKVRKIPWTCWSGCHTTRLAASPQAER